MTGPFDPQGAYLDPTATAGAGGGSMYGMGAPFGVPLYNLPDFKRQAAFEAMTDAGLNLIKASAPSPYPTDGAQLFGALAGGAAQGGRDAAQRYMQRAMMAGQIRNLALQNQMYPAALKALNSPSQYDPYGGQGGAPQPQPQDQPGSNAPMTAGAPNDNNIGNVKTPDLKGFARVPDFNSGVKLAADTVRGYGNGKTIAQIGATYAPPSENDTGAWVKNVASISGLDPNKPLDLSDPQTAASLVRGIHGAEKGGSAVQPLANYLPGVTGKFTPIQYTPQQGQPVPPQAQPQGAPQFPINPPDPSKYNALRMLGGQWAKQADALYERDKQRYEAAKNVWESQMKSRAQASELANKPVDAAGNVQPGPLAAEGEKKRVEAEAQEKARTNALYGGPGWEKMPSDKLRAQANPELVTITEGIQNGQIRMADIGTRQSPAGVTFGKNDVQALGRKLYGEGWDPNAGDRREKFMSDVTDTNTQTGKTIYAVNTLYKHADQWQDLFLNIGNSESPGWNHVRKWLADNTGKSNYTTPEALSHAVGTELANVIKGQQLNMPEVEAAVESLRTTQSPKQGMDAINALMHAMQARESTMTFGAKRAKVPDAYISSLIDPDAKAAFSHFNQKQVEFRKGQTPPDAAAIKLGPAGEGYDKVPAGTQYVAPDGSLRIKGGK